MNIDKLNEYIAHYLYEDKTHSAIMLTAPWGTGKSYYIQNSLIPFIDTEEERKCIVVSLYGLKEVQEISKAIYMEVRAKSLIKKSEKISAGKLICKTIIKGVTSFFNVDLSMSEDDLQKLYESIDLAGKLIILEDLERTGIDIIELLGYVNSLVEQDGVKVLLVANEREIIKYDKKEIIEKDSKGKDESKTILVLSEKSQRYLNEKEKSISDTIYYLGDIKGAIKNIMVSYDNPIFNLLIEEEDIFGECAVASEIYNEIMQDKNINCENLRSFIYACQKTVDIFTSVSNKVNVDFAKRTFLSIVAFSLQKKQNDNLQWDSKLSYSQKLGTYKYPLLEYCYYYICFQMSCPNEFKEAEKNYIEQQEIQKQIEKQNDCLNIIYYFYDQREVDVVNAVKNVKELLKDINKIYPSQYGKLSNYLIAIKYAIGNNEDADECKKLMLENIPKANGDELADRLTYYNRFALEGEALIEFQAFKQEMLGLVTRKQKELFNFDYSVEHLDDFCRNIYANCDSLISHHAFAIKIDNDKLIKLFMNCSAKQISEIHAIYRSIYAPTNINEFLSGDLDSILELKEKIEHILRIHAFDKIQIMQLESFLTAIEDIAQKLQGGN